MDAYARESAETIMPFIRVHSRSFAVQLLPSFAAGRDGLLIESAAIARITI